VTDQPKVVVPRIADLTNLLNKNHSTNDLLYCNEKIFERKAVVVAVATRHDQARMQRSGYNEDSEEDILSEEESGFDDERHLEELSETSMKDATTINNQQSIPSPLTLERYAANQTSNLVSLHTSTIPYQAEGMEVSQPIQHTWQPTKLLIGEMARSLKQDLS
jgi:hypothetical protein